MNVLTTETSDTSTTHSNPSHADTLKAKNPFISSIATNLFAELFNNVDKSLEQQRKKSLIECDQKDGLIKSIIEIAKILIDKGADINALISGSTALQKALDRDNTELVRVLLEKKAKLSHENPEGFQALHLAVLRENIDAIKLLLNKNEIDVNAYDKSGHTPLHWALICGSLRDKRSRYQEAVKLLLARPEIDVNIQNKYGETSLHYVVKIKSCSETIKCLLNHPNINVNSQNKSRETPLGKAIEYTNVEAIKYLLNHSGIDVNFKNSSKNTFSNHLLYSVIYEMHQKGETKSVVTLLDQPEVDLNAKNNDGYTAIHIAAKHQKKDMLLALNNAGAELSCTKDRNDQWCWSSGGKNFSNEENIFMRQIFAQEISNNLKRANK